jgi:hypothetical protein
VNPPIKLAMKSEKPFGLYLLKKQSEEHIVLKDLLQFMKSVSPAPGLSFSYIEAKNSLHSHLSLWENLQIEVGTSSWKDFQKGLRPEQQALINLLKEPFKKGCEAEIWEKFIISFLKGLISPSKNLLIDMDEGLVSPVLIQNFKKTILSATNYKTIFLASANTSLWLDCAHSLVNRKEYTFIIESLSSESIKKNWMAG